MIFATGLNCPEGPVVLPDGSWVVVETGAERGCVTHISANGRTRRILNRTGRPNGLAVDRDHVIWVAESSPPSLIRMKLDGSYEVVMTGCHDDPFLFPNDLCFGPDGALYLTDSGIRFEDFAPGGRIRDDYLTAPYDGRIYRIVPATLEIRRIDRGIKFTNGIAFGVDGHLYANETITGAVMRYRWKGGTLGPREEFGNVLDPAKSGFRGPDGMAFSEDGRLYCTVAGQGDVAVLGRDGRLIDRIYTQGAFPTNCAFGLNRERKLYVTEFAHGQMEVFDVDAAGLPLMDGSMR